MQQRLHSRFLKRTTGITTILLLLISLTSRADTIFLQSGASVRGQIIGFDGRQYRVEIEGETFNYEADEIRSFTIERGVSPATGAPQQQQQNLEPLLQKLYAIDSKLDYFMSQYQTSTTQLQQKLFDLNPISQLRVLDQTGEHDRQGNFTVRGRLLNESNDFIRNYSLQTTLYDHQGNELRTQQTRPRVPNIGPGGTARFEVAFPNAPRQIANVRIVPFLETRDTSQDIGGYQIPHDGSDRFRR